MISLLIEIALVLGIVVLGSYILDNLVVALIVCFVICTFFSRKSKKKKEEPKNQHDILKDELKEILDGV